MGESISCFPPSVPPSLRNHLTIFILVGVHRMRFLLTNCNYYGDISSFNILKNIEIKYNFIIFLLKNFKQTFPYFLQLIHLKDLILLQKQNSRQ